MKPSFALVLSQDTIGLLHRTLQGWQPVGEVAVSDPDLTGALSGLRAAALGLDPRGITSKLVIPDSEILYTTVNAPGPSAAARRSQIKAALQGRTPYAVSELVYDWTGSGPEVQVAVVARETLQEAEAFAAEHQLGPLSFVGSPDSSLFAGEPWFGAAAGAASLLPAGEKVERDNALVPVPARQGPATDAAAGDAPAAEPVPDAPAEMPAAEPVAPATPAEPEAVAVEETEAATVAAVDADLTGPADPVIEVARVPMPEPVMPPAVEPVAQGPSGAEGVRAEPVAAHPVAPVGEVHADRPAPVLDNPNPPPLGRPVRAEVIAQSLEVPPDDPPVRSAAGSSAPAVERLKARLAEQPVGPDRFGERARGFGTVPPPLGQVPGGGKAGGTPQPGVRALKAVPGGGTPSRPAATTAPRPAVVGRVPAKGARAAALMVTSPSIPLPRDRRVNIPTPEPSGDARTKAAPDSRKAAKADAEGLTAFGTKQSRRGKPRYLGLILTGLLLIFLAVVAAWSTLYLASDGSQQAIPVAATPAATPPAAASADSAATVASGTDAAASGPTTAVVAAAGSTAPPEAPRPVAAMTKAAAPVAPEPQGDAAAQTAAAAQTGTTATTPDAEPVPAPAPVAALSTSGSAAVGAAAPAEGPAVPQADATGQIGRAPVEEPQDEIFLAMTDAAVPVEKVIALAPPVAAADAPPGAQPLPPPFGTVYQFDANGMIVPTAEGIVTPEGVLLISGKPPKTPPERPAALAAASATVAVPNDPAAVAATEAPAAAASVSGVVAPPAAETAPAAFASDPALAGARPRSRPAELAPVPPAAGDDASLPPAAETQVASLKPRARPASVLAEGQAAQTEAADAAIQSAAASISGTEANASPLAIAVSRKPAPRPADFSKAVEAAVASVAPAPVAAAVEPAAEPAVALTAPEPKPTPGAIPQATPEDPKAPEEPKVAAAEKDDPVSVEIDEPEVTSAAPSLPTHANVAKQATFRNAINLSRLNLIGVYGSASNRYALVRQPNGRYVKVSVGDRVDGGKVAAISDRELSYVKNGRTVTLEMPKT